MIAFKIVRARIHTQNGKNLFFIAHTHRGSIRSGWFFFVCLFSLLENCAKMVMRAERQIFVSDIDLLHKVDCLEYEGLVLVWRQRVSQRESLVFSEYLW